jgi:hypothetical protein
MPVISRLFSVVLRVAEIAFGAVRTLAHWSLDGAVANGDVGCCRYCWILSAPMDLGRGRFLAARSMDLH